jgi:phage baseplate assembly protein V
MNEALQSLAETGINMLAEVRITQTDDTQPVQTVDIEGFADESLTERERFQPYGLSTHAPVGSRAVMLCMNGERSHVIVLGGEDEASRIKHLKAGEVVFYSQHGQTILLNKAGEIVLMDKAGSILKLATSGNIEATPASGTMVLNGKLQATGDVIAGAISLQNHVHSGVKPGPSNTGGPQ